MPSRFLVLTLVIAMLCVCCGRDDAASSVEMMQAREIRWPDGATLCCDCTEPEKTERVSTRLVNGRRFDPASKQLVALDKCRSMGDCSHRSRYSLAPDRWVCGAARNHLHPRLEAIS